MEQHLIREVSRYPIIYDTTLDEYKHPELKNAAWNSITTSLFNSSNPFIVEKVKNKWKNLRDTFVKSQKKKERPNSKPWKLEEEMKFLIPFLNPRLSLGSTDGCGYDKLQQSPGSPEIDQKYGRSDPYIKTETTEESDSFTPSSEDSMAMIQHVEAVMEEELPSRTSPKRTQITEQRKRKRVENFRSCEQVKHFMDVSEQSEPQGFRMDQPPFQYDAIDAYFLGLAQTVKKLKPVKQVLLKKAISILVFDAELRETECDIPTSSQSEN